MINCGKAAGIKLYPGGSAHGTATVTNVTWSGITVSGCAYGAQIQSCYGNTAAYCAEYPSAATLSTNRMSQTLTAQQTEPVVFPFQAGTWSRCLVARSISVRILLATWGSHVPRGLLVRGLGARHT
jgi:hypothetical protein